MSRKLATEVRSGVTLSLPPLLVRELNAYCTRYHISRSQAGEVAIRRFLLNEAAKEGVFEHVEVAADLQNGGIKINRDSEQ